MARFFAILLGSAIERLLGGRSHYYIQNGGVHVGQLDREAATAARWWRDRLSIHHEHSDDELDRFERELARIIGRELDANEGYCQIVTDYNTNHLILEAGVAANVNAGSPGLFGCASMMAISPGRVYVDNIDEELPLLEVMKRFDREAGVAAKWFADKLREGTLAFETCVSGHPDTYEMMKESRTRIARAQDPEAVNRFERKLAEKLIPVLEEKGGILLIGLHSSPDGVLAEALALAGLPADVLPWRTWVYVKPGNVRASGDKVIQLDLVEG